jgi:hypothetical protein
MPPSASLITDPFPHCDEWSEENLPEILFYLKPPKSGYLGQSKRYLMENGKHVRGSNGQKLHDFPILPRRISLLIPGWLIEAWRRIDPRINYEDILDRQTADDKYQLIKLDKNALQNHCRRECRMILGLWTKYERREEPHRTDVEAIESLSYQNVMLNTILNVCPGRQDRLAKIRLTRRCQDGEGKYYTKPFEINETNLYGTTFAIDHFVLKAELPADGLHAMDDGMLAAWELSLILQERARNHGFDHWKKLPDGCRPVSWFDRVRNKREAHETFDYGCEVCTWDAKRDQRMHKAWIESIKSALPKAANPNPAPRISADSGALVSKKRKLDDADGAAATLQESEELTCECCERATDSGQYPSERFLRGDFNSFLRDKDRIEEVKDETAPSAQIAATELDRGDGGNVHQGEDSETQETVMHDMETDFSSASNQGSQLVSLVPLSQHWL